MSLHSINPFKSQQRAVKGNLVNRRTCHRHTHTQLHVSQASSITGTAGFSLGNNQPDDEMQYVRRLFQLLAKGDRVTVISGTRMPVYQIRS